MVSAEHHSFLALLCHQQCVPVWFLFCEVYKKKSALNELAEFSKSKGKIYFLHGNYFEVSGLVRKDAVIHVIGRVLRTVFSFL